MVKGIADGSLPHETFRRYFIQNVLYLEEYARAIGIIVGKAPDRDCADHPDEVPRADRRDGDPLEPRLPRTTRGRPGHGCRAGVMLPVTYAYTRHLLSTCALGDCADGLTAVLPCQWSYGELARPLTADPPGDPIFADWIGLFGNDEYDALVARTTPLLDRLVVPTDEGRVSALSKIFERSTWYEVAFWDMAYANTADPTWEGGGTLMRAVRIHEDLSLRVDELVDLEAGGGNVLVRIHAAGVCGTDLHILDGMIKPDAYPMTLGHEAAGIIEDVGEGGVAGCGNACRHLQQDLLRPLRAMPQGPNEHL